MSTPFDDDEDRTELEALAEACRAEGVPLLSFGKRRSMRVTGHYVLVGQTPVPETDLLTWADAHEKAGESWRVAFTELPWCHVSTIFLGLDHSFFSGPPILFETMTFWSLGMADADAWEQTNGLQPSRELLNRAASCTEISEAATLADEWLKAQ